MGKKLYLIEYYAKNLETGASGWYIKFAWTKADTKNEAKIKMNDIKDFDEVIQITEQTERVPLSTGNGIDSSIFVF